MSTKRSIEKEVTERKRHEKDHYDSNFIYQKVANKTCKETIIHAQKVINDLTLKQ